MNPIAAALVEPIFDLISEVVTDKDKALELTHKTATLAGDRAHELQMGQIGVNKTEAAHKSILVAGWRPFVGWVCGVGLLYNVLLYPVLDIWLDMPDIEVSLLLTTLGGMLGFGGMRSWEKSKGIARNP